jgi:hypothetical protein
LTECYEHNCHKEASGFKGFRGQFCRRCIISPEAFTLPCTVCKGTFTKHTLMSKMPLYCSDVCRNRAGYLRRRKIELEKGIDRRGYKPNNRGNILDVIMKRRSTSKMISEKTGHKERSVPTLITRLRKQGWNIKNYHGYFELEEDSK